MEKRPLRDDGPYQTESHEVRTLASKKVQILVLVVLAGGTFMLAGRALLGGRVANAVPNRATLKPEIATGDDIEMSRKVDSIIQYPIRPFGEENVDKAVEEKIVLLQKVIDLGLATAVPENETVVNRLNDMIYRHFELTLDVRDYESIEHVEIDIISHYIRDQFLYISLTRLEEKPKYNVTRIHRPSQRERSKRRIRFSASDDRTEEVSCDGLFVQELRDDVVYIKIQHFRDSNLNEVLREVLRANQGKFVVLNLEDNPGGRLNEVFQVCDLLPGVRTIAEESDTGAAYTTSAEDDEWGRIKDLICIFNGGSASASEILLADCRSMGYVLYGTEPSHGKNAYGYGYTEQFEGYEANVYRSAARIRDGEVNKKIVPHVYLPASFSEFDFRVRLLKNPEKEPQLVLDEMIAELMAEEQ